MSEQGSANLNAARALVSLSIGIVLMLLSILFGLGGCDRVAGWLAVGMWIALVRAMWIGVEIRS